MKIKLRDIIGKEIRDVKFKYLNDNGYGLQEFTTFVKLSNDLIFTIPYFHNEELSVFDEKIKTEYLIAQNLSKDVLMMLRGKKIIDFHFVFFEKELDEQEKAIVELEGELYLTEVHHSPIGLTNVDLKILNKKEFILFKNEIECEKGFEIKSIMNTNVI